MRLWTIHPKYLDSIGLVVLWRESILAKCVLEGKTRGYRNHPQLIRFREQSDPVKYINRYLEYIYDESCARGYCFDDSKFIKVRKLKRIEVTDGQLLYEWKHLKAKLRSRSPECYSNVKIIKIPEPNPLFMIVEGGIPDWEKR